MEQAIQKAGRSKFRPGIRHSGDRPAYRAEIGPVRFREVGRDGRERGDAHSDHRGQALKRPRPSGDFITDPCRRSIFGRIAAQTAKQVIVQKVPTRAQAPVQRFKDRRRRNRQRIGQAGRVRATWSSIRPARGDAAPRRIVAARELPQGEAGARLYLTTCRGSPRPANLPVATHPQYMAKLFAQEVPEIYDGIIEIKALAATRVAAPRIAVISRDSSIDPVGACSACAAAASRRSSAKLQARRSTSSRVPRIRRLSSSTGLPGESAKGRDGTGIQRRIEVVVPDDH